jgi:hypothetical protein
MGGWRWAEETPWLLSMGIRHEKADSLKIIQVGRFKSP